jgi:hypothetical protein
VLIDVPYEFGDMVYLKTDDDVRQRVITAVKILPNSSVIYELTCGTQISHHYEFEFTTEYDLSKKLKSNG